MKIALVGTGRMNEAVKTIALAQGHDIVLSLGRRDNDGGGGLTAEALAAADVAIEFTTPEAAAANAAAIVATGTPAVIGTTGWYDRLDEVRAAVDAAGTGLVYGANFSIGANLLVELTRRTTAALARFTEYDPYVFEHHHRRKRDAPSGTAQRLADAILSEHPTKTRMHAGPVDGTIAPDALHVASVRAGEAFGHHRVAFDSSADVLELVHTARGRDGFARGALAAAAWVRDRTGCFEFSTIFDEMIST